MSTAVLPDRSKAGEQLREARERLGLSRVQLAALADVSISALNYIEQGAVPRRSRVLQRAWVAIEDLKNSDAPGRTGATQEVSDEGAQLTD